MRFYIWLTRFGGYYETHRIIKQRNGSSVVEKTIPFWGERESAQKFADIYNLETDWMDGQVVVSDDDLPRPVVTHTREVIA